ncbi:MAG TPA: transposase, partial [Gaiellaceae bacterium]|nr:transposase [Gaiellaceae bacterium]
MPRAARSSLPDGVFHVTARAVSDLALFVDDADRHGFVHQLRQLEARYDVGCLGYCLMATHYHLLLEGSTDALQVFMQRLNGGYAARFNRRHRRYGHVFGDRYTARLVEGEGQLEAVLD